MRCDETGRHLRAPRLVATLLALALTVTFVGAMLGRLESPGAVSAPGPSLSGLHGAARADRFEAPSVALRIVVPARQSTFRFARWMVGVFAATVVALGLGLRAGRLVGAPLGTDRVALAMFGLRRRGPPLASR